MDNPVTGHDDNVSWDGRKTADFEKFSNDGLWVWNGVEWQPQKITEKKTSQYFSEEASVVSPGIGDVSDDGFWRWNGTMWMPCEVEPRMAGQEEIIQPVKKKLLQTNLQDSPDGARRH